MKKTLGVSQKFNFSLVYCVQGRRCVLKDCCKILDNTVLPPETVVPPFTVFSGCPGQLHHTNTHLTPPLCVYLSGIYLCLSISLRSIFRRAPRVHAGPDDWCNQELLPEVPASQPDLSPAPKPSAGSTPFPTSSRSGLGSLIRNGLLRAHLLSFTSQRPWVSQPKDKHWY